MKILATLGNQESGRFNSIQFISFHFNSTAFFRTYNSTWCTTLRSMTLWRTRPTVKYDTIQRTLYTNITYTHARARGRAHLDGVIGRAVLVEPRVDQWDVDRSPHAPLPQVVRSRGPVQPDARRRAVRVDGQVVQDGHHLFGQLEVFILLLPCSSEKKKIKMEHDKQGQQ